MLQKVFIYIKVIVNVGSNLCTNNIRIKLYKEIKGTNFTSDLAYILWENE